MSRDERFKDADWGVHRNGDGTVTYYGAQLAVLMDIRDELKRMNAVLHCANLLNIPSKLDQIRRNTMKPRKRVKK